jgi:hypothetical protein
VSQENNDNDDNSQEKTGGNSLNEQDEVKTQIFLKIHM